MIPNFNALDLYIKRISFMENPKTISRLRVHEKVVTRVLENRTHMTCGKSGPKIILIIRTTGYQPQNYAECWLRLGFFIRWKMLSDNKRRRFCTQDMMIHDVPIVGIYIFVHRK